MRKKTLLATCILIALCVPLSLYAIDLGGDLADKAAQGAGYAKTTDTSFAETIGVVIKTALSFVGVIFLVLTVYAGFLWMLARGDEGQIEKAQKIIQSAIIGMIITVGAYSITAFVVPRIVSKTAGGQVGGGSGGGGNVCSQRYDDCQANCERDNGGNVGAGYKRGLETACMRLECSDSCSNQLNGVNVGEEVYRCEAACEAAC